MPLLNKVSNKVSNKVPNKTQTEEFKPRLYLPVYPCYWKPER